MEFRDASELVNRHVEACLQAGWTDSADLQAATLKNPPVPASLRFGWLCSLWSPCHVVSSGPSTKHGGL